MTSKDISYMFENFQERTIKQTLSDKLKRIFSSKENSVYDIESVIYNLESNRYYFQYFLNTCNRIKENPSLSVYNEFRLNFDTKVSSVFTDYFNKCKDAIYKDDFSKLIMLDGIRVMLLKIKARENSVHTLSYYLRCTNLELKIKENLEQGMKFSKALKKGLNDCRTDYRTDDDNFQDEFKKENPLTDSDIQFLSERLSHLKDIDVIITESMNMLLTRENWNNILQYAGNNHSCWMPSGCYHESSDILNEYIEKGQGGLTLFFARESDIKQDEESPYITYKDEKMILCGRLWYVKENQDNVYFNPYHLIYGLNDSDFLSLFFQDDFHTVNISHTESIYINGGEGYSLSDINRIEIGDENENRFTCRDCGDVLYDDELYQDENGYTYCESCYNDRYFHCSNCDNEFSTDERIIVEYANRYRVNHYHSVHGELCENCFNQYFARCENCDEIIHLDDSMEENGLTYCSSCHDELFTYCESCGCNVNPDESYKDENGDVICESCSENMLTCELCECKTEHVHNFANKILCDSCHAHELRKLNAIQLTIFFNPDSESTCFKVYPFYDNVNGCLYM